MHTHKLLVTLFLISACGAIEAQPAADAELQKELTELKLEQEVADQKQENEAREQQRFFEAQKGWGISTGVIWATGEGERSYVSGAYVDPLGIVRVRKRLEKVNRVFPAVSFFLQPLYKSKSEPYQPLAVGVTFGLSEGGNNDAGGPSMAYGITLGIAVKNVHIALFYGRIRDTTVRELPWYVVQDFRVPEGPITTFIDSARTDATATAALALSEGLELPSPTVTAEYDALGIVFNFSF